MALRQLRIAVQVPHAATRGTRLLKPEGFQVFIDFQYVVLVSRAGADYIARLDIVLPAFAQDLGLTSEDEPVLMEVVEMAVERTSLSRDSEDSGACDLAPVGAIARMERLCACSHYRHVLISLSFPIAFSTDRSSIIERMSLPIG